MIDLKTSGVLAGGALMLGLCAVAHSRNASRSLAEVWKKPQRGLLLRKVEGVLQSTESLMMMLNSPNEPSGGFYNGSSGGRKLEDRLELYSLHIDDQVDEVFNRVNSLRETVEEARARSEE